MYVDLPRWIKMLFSFIHVCIINTIYVRSCDIYKGNKIGIFLYLIGTGYVEPCRISALVVV